MLNRTPEPPASDSDKVPWGDWTDVFILIAWAMISSVIAHNLYRKKKESSLGRS